MPRTRPRINSLMALRASTIPAAELAAELALALALELAEDEAVDPEDALVVLTAEPVFAEPEPVAVEEAVFVEALLVSLEVRFWTRNQLAASGCPNPAASAKPDMLNGYLAFTSAGGLKDA